MICISTKHFVAGAELKDGRVIRAAPIIKYMVGWKLERVIAYCNEKRWLYKVIE